MFGIGFKTFFSLNTNLNLRFIQRKANKIARAACNNASLANWLETPPFIIEALTIDYSFC